MFGKLFSDRASVPELDQFMEQDIDRMQAELAGGLAAAFAAHGRRAERLDALIRPTTRSSTPSLMHAPPGGPQRPNVPDCAL